MSVFFRTSASGRCNNAVAPPQVLRHQIKFGKSEDSRGNCDREMLQGKLPILIDVVVLRELVHKLVRLTFNTRVRCIYSPTSFKPFRNSPHFLPTDRMIASQCQKSAPALKPSILEHEMTALHAPHVFPHTCAKGGGTFLSRWRSTSSVSRISGAMRSIGRVPPAGLQQSPESPLTV